MEEYTNKYMQVFDTYDQFAQNSADYVKGEDHIAYLIQENEVIYWLYLEQVWRPLNVRTTTTGQLEDGRSKVAVRLECVEGGQKYTSVPNIPDPERITSMSHFLEDYPDIEEVNVTGTVNLTDLSYAFAGSKIKDFSKLDTSNVTTAALCLSNINDNTLNFIISFAKRCNINYIIGDSVINNFTINSSEIVDYDITNNDSVVNTITLNVNEESSNGLYGKINVIKTNGNLDMMGITCNNITCKRIDILPANIENNFDECYINSETTIFNDNNQYFSPFYYKYIINSGIVYLKNQTSTRKFSSSFGNGIKYININVDNANTIGNFIFTTPIVDDAFYAKYNHPISIFQYKTTFTEVADVNITEATDSSLIYVDWGSIDFDTDEMSIEFYNIDNDDLLYINTTLLHFKKFIADNTNISFDVNNKYDNTLTAILNITADEGYISGNYNTYNGFNLIINDLYKNINIYNAYRVILNKNITDDRNIKIYAGDVYEGRVNEEQVIITDIDFDEEIININSFVHDNKLLFGIESQWSNLNKPTLAPIANYIDGLEIYIDDTGDSLNAFYNYFLNSKENNPIHIGTRRTYKGIDMFNFHYVNINKYKDNIENIYLDMGDYVYLAPSLYNDNGILKNIFNIINIKGVVNIVIGLYNSIAMNTPITNNETSLRHIDINKTFCNNSSNHILYYKYCDDETNTNLITKLIDNTRSSIKTIYMYRSQANIIGDDNIAAAVAKNYEFAIIEN